MRGKTRFLSAIELFATTGEEKTDTFGSILRSSAMENRWKNLHWMKPNAMSMLTVLLRHEVQSLQPTIEHFRLANVLSRCSLQSMCVILFIGRNLLIQTQKALPLIDMELVTDQKP
jgi:hypothetical protein